MVPARSDALRRGVFDVEVERYDLQFCIVTPEEFRADEVTIYSNFSSEEVQLVPLSRRPSALQMNWQAVDGEGKKLVIVTEAELATLHEELFPEAARYFAMRRDVPSVLAQLFQSENWEQSIATGEWTSNVERIPDARDELLAYFSHVIGGFTDELGPLQRAALLFIEYVRGRLQGDYQPWVYLNRPLGAGPAGKPFVPDKVLVKYSVDDRLRLSLGGRISHALLGTARFLFRLPFRPDSSNHLRVQLPRGGMFTRTLAPPVGVTLHGWTRDKAHFYVSEKEAPSAWRRTQRIDWQATVTQTPTMRLIAALFLVLSVGIPLMLATMRLGSGNFGFVAAVTIIDQHDLRLAAQVALPLAITLVASAWERPWVRSFAVTQLMLAVTALVFMGFGPLNPTAIVGLAILVCLLAAAHVIMAFHSILDLPPDKRSHVAERKEN